MSRAVIVVNGNYDRDRAAQWAKSAPSGCIIEFKQSKRTLDQNSRLWACLTEIARKVDWYGQKLPPDDWKDVFTAALRRTRVVPGIDAGTFVPLGMRTSDMTKQEFSDLLELINAFAAERGITFDFDDHQSSDAPSSDEGSGEASPHAATPANPSEPNSDEAGEPAGEAPNGSDAAGSPVDNPRNTPKNCIDAMLKTAATDMPVADKRDLLEKMKDYWKEALPDRHDFVRECLQVADKVAKGEQQEQAARRYLEVLP